MRKPFIAGNWKMNLGRREARAMAGELREALSGLVDREVAVFPTFVSVADVADVLDESKIRVGGQDVHMADDGAFTGEVSASILRSAGAQLVIIGHSERRHVMGETDEVIGAKMRAALAHGLDPILCVGELLEERERGQTEAVIGRQTRAGLAAVPREQMARVTVAYEPVWAIGTGKTATPEMAQETHAAIRSLVASIYDRQTAEDLRIQYGGSVKPNNVDGLMAMPDVDGALVGGASLDAASFVRIVRFERSTA